MLPHPCNTNERDSRALLLMYCNVFHQPQGEGRLQGCAEPQEPAEGAAAVCTGLPAADLDQEGEGAADQQWMWGACAAAVTHELCIMPAVAGKVVSWCSTSVQCPD